MNIKEIAQEGSEQEAKPWWRQSPWLWLLLAGGAFFAWKAIEGQRFLGEYEEAVASIGKRSKKRR